MKNVKYILLSLTALLIVATSILTTACDRNENGIVPFGRQPGGTSNGNGNALRIVTSKQPFADETGTRADTDFGGTYATTFETGDEIGITAVKDGAVLADCNNVKLIYNATEGKWEGNDVSFVDGATYIAYSPYRAVMDGKKSTQEIYDAFTVSTNQNTAELYAANDLMTSTTCTADKTAKTLTIAFEHRMAMLEISPVLYGYDLTYLTSERWAYPIKNSSVSSVSVGDGYIQPFKNTGEATDAPYRCLVKPVTSKLSISYSISSDAGGKYPVPWSINNQSFIGGQRRKIRPQKRRSIAVGDYYYSDGSIFPGNMTFSTIPGKDQGCIGVVFAMGETGYVNGDTHTNYSGSGLTGAIHGYVVALDDANGGNTCSWGSKTKVGTSTSETDFLGYSNTKKIQAMYGYDLNYWPACWVATNYTPSAPSNSSGWFFLSIGQLRTIANNKATLNTAFSKVGGTEFNSSSDIYSSSSENSSEYSLSMFVTINYMTNYIKSNKSYIRSCLAF